VTEIRAARGLVPLNLRELWEFRDLAFFMFWHDLKGGYRQTAFGPLWLVANPIINMILFTVIFGVVARLPSDGTPYPLFSYSALLPWGFFTGVLGSAGGTLLNYKHLISNIYFPRLIIPIVGVFSLLLNFLISFVILLGMMLYYGYAFRWTMLLAPVFLLLAAMAGLGVGLWFAPWKVHFHDVDTMLSYLVRISMYASPVVYASSLVPARWQTLYHLNPMTNVIEGMRWALLGTAPPSPGYLLLSFGLVLPVLVSGAYYFRKTERNIVDIA
jgi:lipopolysaccharide transport system permease protein